MKLFKNYGSTRFFLVFMPKNVYNGQKPINDVTTKTNAKMPRIMAAVPEITFVKYNIATSAAIKIRTVLSIELMFFFIVVFFKFKMPEKYKIF